MKHFSNQVVEDLPLQKQTILSHGKDFPTKPKIPSLYYRDDLKQLYLAADQWYMMPYGTFDQVTAFKSASSCRIVKGNQIPCDLGGTYLIDAGLAEKKIVKLPAPGVVQGLIFNIKNIGPKYIILEAGPMLAIDQYEQLTVHPNQVVTLQCFENKWYILNIFLPASL